MAQQAFCAFNTPRSEGHLNELHLTARSTIAEGKLGEFRAEAPSAQLLEALAGLAPRVSSAFQSL